ncbi:MAG: hypothetical protein AAFZ65_00245 [Planctomycetota bacterium]
MQVNPCILHPAFTDSGFWDTRLSSLSTTPRQLLVFPRQELALPGGEASEIWLRAHDRTRLRALFARSAVAAPRSEVLVSLVDDLHGRRLDWDQIADGRPQCVLERQPGRRLEDRVLDLIRLIRAARDLARIEDQRLGLRASEVDRGRDEVMIVERLLAEGRA